MLDVQTGNNFSGNAVIERRFAVYQNLFESNSLGKLDFIIGPPRPDIVIVVLKKHRLISRSMHGDDVVVKVFSDKEREDLIKGGHRISDSERPACVICVATRNKFAQQLSWSCRADPFCITSRIFCPLDVKFPKIFVPDSNLESIQEDDVFIVEYCEWPSSAPLPIGKVVGQVAKPSSSSSVLKAGVKQIFFKCGHSIVDEKILLNT